VVDTEGDPETEAQEECEDDTVGVVDTLGLPLLLGVALGHPLSVQDTDADGLRELQLLGEGESVWVEQALGLPLSVELCEPDFVPVVQPEEDTDVVIVRDAVLQTEDDVDTVWDTLLLKEMLAQGEGEGEVEMDGDTLGQELGDGEAEAHIVELGEPELVLLTVPVAHCVGETLGDTDALGVTDSVGETLEVGHIVGEVLTDEVTEDDRDAVGQALGEGDKLPLPDTVEVVEWVPLRLGVMLLEAHLVGETEEDEHPEAVRETEDVGQ
jgi:hypothetical protein